MHLISCLLYVQILVIAGTLQGIADVRNGKAAPGEKIESTIPARPTSNVDKHAINESVSCSDPTNISFLHEREEWFSIPGAPNRREQSKNKLKMMVSVDYHWEKKLIFYSWRNRIWRANFAGEKLCLMKAVPIVKIGVDGPLSLAVDWVNDRLYWMTTRHQAVEVSDLEGKGRTLLVDNIRTIQEYNNIVVDPYEGFFFFVSDYSVFRSNLKATRIVRLDIDANSRGQVDYGVRCIALDRKEKRVYITGLLPPAKDNVPFLDHVNYDGTDTKPYFPENSNVTSIMSMDFLNGVLYFQTNEIIHSYMAKPDKVNPENLNISPSQNQAAISTVRVLHPYGQRNCSKARD